MNKYRILLSITLLWTVSLCAQDALTLDAIYKSGAFRQKGIPSVRWMKDNKSFSTVEANKIWGGWDIVTYQARRGTRTTLVDASQLVPTDAPAPLDVEDYTWSEDNSKLMVFTNSKRVWRYNTKGDYWVLDLNSGKLQQLGKSLPASELMFAKFSPSADRVAYVCQNNIYVEDLATETITPITTDGCDYLVNGTFDWVYEEELSCRDGFRWSPDGQSIAYWQSDTRGTGVFYLINNVDSLYSKTIALPYPKAGTTNSAVKVGVVSASGGQTRWIDIPGDPRNNYLARMDFIPKSNELMIQQLNRLQNTNRVYTVSAETLEWKNILTDVDSAFVDIHDNICWLDNETSFTWTSEKDGWRHLYKVSRDGTQEQLITKGPFDVISVECIDIKGGYVYYMASPNSAINQYLFRSRLDGTEEAQRITPAEFVGTHSYQLSGDARWAMHTYQNSTTPPTYDLVELPTHKRVRMLEDNKTLKETYANLGLTPKEFFQVRLDNNVLLDGWMIKPAGFDETKKYPVIFQIYGEPASSTVQNTWSGGELWHHYLAQQGYLVMSIDPRGTNMPRGREWRKCIYGQVGVLASADHAQAVLKAERKFPFMDADRIGIWGWSGGGSMTLNAMFRYPDIYSTGIAVAFVSDQELYDTIYQERYMGLPSENSEGYRNGSPITHAGNLEGNLLLIHGTGDDNVHYQNCEMLINELIRTNKLFSLMVYPMRTHGIYEYPNTTFHLYNTMEVFWKKNL